MTLPPRPGSRWRHWRGGTYVVVLIAQHHETGEPGVVYRADGRGNDTHYWRPAAEWADPKGVDNTPRFMAIQ